MKYAAWGVGALECDHCFGLSGLIALIIVPGKTGWLMDVTGAVAAFKLEKLVGF